MVLGNSYTGHRCDNNAVSSQRVNALCPSVELPSAAARIVASAPRRRDPTSDSIDPKFLSLFVGIVTDAYLAQLARSRNGQLATLDSGLAHLHSDVAVLVPTTV